MITYDQDPDVVRWGLQLFDGDPYSDCGYCGAISQNIPQYYHQQYCQEDHYDMGQCNEDNDELNANLLQEELSQLSVAEPAQTANEAVEHQTTFYSQDWFPEPVGNYNFGDENGQEVMDESRQSGSCSSPEGKYFGEEWSYSLELTDEYAWDDEVGKRFNQMVPIPHIPRINGEIPSVDEATLDHQRLLQRLQVYELVECKVQGDGNCQANDSNQSILFFLDKISLSFPKVQTLLPQGFRALSDQFYRTSEHHKFVRQQVVNQLKSSPENYEGYVPMAYNDYLKKMSKNGEWGDHVTLQAAADSYGVKIFVITSFKDTCYIEIVPNSQKSERVISLSFWAEVHYNSIYPEGDMPSFETKKKQSLVTEGETWESQDDYD